LRARSPTLLANKNEQSISPGAHQRRDDRGVFAIISVGLALVFGVTDIVNFSQGSFLMVGMYMAYSLFVWLSIDPLLATPLVRIRLFRIRS
jgi:ABC-type branched-subunit amino acid transport system permease subunit